MRHITIALVGLLAVSGLARAESKGPLFGGQAAGTFLVADQQTELHRPVRYRVQAVNDCASLNCPNLFKTASLRVSGKKP
jgi:hypothetical protein